jgi:hypothetical protein
VLYAPRLLVRAVSRPGVPSQRVHSPVLEAPRSLEAPSLNVWFNSIVTGLTCVPLVYPFLAQNLLGLAPLFF